MAFKASIDFDYFFDRAKVQKHLSTQERRALNKVGGVYRKVVKGSMKPGGKKNVSAEPGRPPRTHTKALKRGILYQYEPESSSVVIGARKLNGKKAQQPRVLELGGETNGRRLREIRVNGKKQSVPRERVRYRMQPRPFVGEQSVNWDKAISTLNSVRKEFF